MKKLQKIMSALMLCFTIAGNCSVVTQAFSIFNDPIVSYEEDGKESSTFEKSIVPKIVENEENKQENDILPPPPPTTTTMTAPPIVKDQNGVEVREEKEFKKHLGVLNLTLDKKVIGKANRYKMPFTKEDVSDTVRMYQQSFEYLKQNNLLSKEEMELAKNNNFTWKEVVTATSTPQSSFRAFHSKEYQDYIANDLQKAAYARIQEESKEKNSFFHQILTFFLGEKANAETASISWTNTYLDSYLGENIADLTLKGKKVFCIEPIVPTQPSSTYQLYSVDDYRNLGMTKFQSENIGLISYFGFTNAGGWDGGSSAGISRYVNTQKVIWNLVAQPSGQAIFNKSFDKFFKNIDVLNTNNVGNAYFTKLKADIKNYMDGGDPLATKTVKADGVEHRFGAYSRFAGSGGDIVSDIPNGVDVHTDNQGYLYIKVNKGYRGDLDFDVTLEEKGKTYTNGMLGNPLGIAQKVGIFGDLPAPQTTVSIRVEMPSSITIKKKDTHDNNAVAGVTYSVRYNDYIDGVKTVTGLKTDTNGNLNITNVTTDSDVQAWETAVPAPYLIDSHNTQANAKSVKATADGKAVINFSNARPTYNMTVSKELLGLGKTVPNSNYAFNKDLTFQILNAKDNNKILYDDVHFDNNGNWTSPTLRFNRNETAIDWIFKEKTAGLLSGQLLNPASTHFKASYNSNVTAHYTLKKDDGSNYIPNKVGRGKIVLNKDSRDDSQNKEFDNQWNEKYTLQNAEFTITPKQDLYLSGAFLNALKAGSYVSEVNMTGDKVNYIKLLTDDKGEAETPEYLPIGQYEVKETKAPNGHVLTFGTKELEIAYVDNQTEVIWNETTQKVQDTDRLITGATDLHKQDTDTQDIEEGRATLAGAEYTLFYNEDIGTRKKDEPVKFTDTFFRDCTTQDIVTAGTVSTTPVEAEALTLTIDNAQNVGVKHLSIGKYYWKETKTPEGYATDTTKHAFEITKQGDEPRFELDNNHQFISNESVIRFDFHFLKQGRLHSMQVPINGAEFKLEPIAPTKDFQHGEKDTDTTKWSDKYQANGYAEFKNIPYGNYKLIETKSPDGFDKIKPLIIKSRLEVDQTDYNKSVYVWEFFEEGYENFPAHSVRVPMDKFNDQNGIKKPSNNYGEDGFRIDLDKLYFFDDKTDTNQIATIALWNNDEKMIDPVGKANAVDEIGYHLTEKGKWFVVTQAIDVNETKKLIENLKQDTTFQALPKDQQDSALKNLKPVILQETTSVQTNVSPDGSWRIKQNFDLSKLAHKKIVYFESLYKTEQDYKDGKAPVISHKDLDDEGQTVEVVEKPEIQTTLTSDTGQKIVEPKQTTTLVDTIKYEKLIVGKEYVATGTLMDKATNKPIVDVYGKKITAQTTFTPTTTNGEVKVTFVFEADIYDKKIVAFETLTQEGRQVAVHADINDEGQTVEVVPKPPVPDDKVTIKTKAHLSKEDQTFKSGDMLQMYDDVVIRHTNAQGQNASYETILIAKYPSGKTKDVWGSGKIAYKATQKELTFTVKTFPIDTSNDPEGTIYHFKEIHYNENDKVNAQHNEKLDIEEQSIKPTNGELPSTFEQIRNNLPHTGEQIVKWLMWIGLGLIAIAVGIWYKRRKDYYTKF